MSELELGENCPPAYSSAASSTAGLESEALGFFPIPRQGNSVAIASRNFG